MTNSLRTVIGALALVGFMATGCGGEKEDYIQFANGFEFDVTAEITDESGGTQILVIPAKGRVGADLTGKATIEFTSPKSSMKKKKYKFATKEDRKEGCFEYVNVLGSAAIVEEDLSFGVGIKSPDKLLLGRGHTKVCPRWGFETSERPESITVKEGTVGMNLTWLHYSGDGDWHASIEKLLSLPPAADDSHRIRAWNLAVAISKHDPDNARLEPLGPSFKAACGKIQDFFTTGPLAGKAEADCLRNTKGLFPK